MTFTEPKIEVASGLSDVARCMEWIDGIPTSRALLGLDVETTGLDQFAPDFAIRTVQIAHGGTVWVLRATDDSAANGIQVLLRRAPLRFVTHGQYDSVALRAAWGVDLTGRLVDSHLLARLVHPSDEVDHGLKSLSERYLGTRALIESEAALHARFKELVAGDERLRRELYRSPRRTASWGFANIDTDDPVFVRYAALDAHACLLLAPALVKILGTGRNVVPMEMRLADIASRMRARGNLVDVDQVTRLLRVADEAIEEHESVIEGATGVGARSPRLGGWLVNEGVAFSQDERTPEGRPSLAKGCIDAVLERERERDPDGEPLRVLEAKRSLMKHTNDKANLQSFLAKADVDWRVHPSVGTLRARTSRMSTTGPALQTLKKDGNLRPCFLAEPGMSLVSVDFSQIEVRVAAALSGDPNLTAPLLAGEDTHSDTAKRLFGEGFTDKQRKTSKMTNFAALYGGGAKTIAAQADIPILEAQSVVRRWRETYPLVVALASSLSTRREIVTPTGRVIPTDPKRPYASLNFLVQSTARDLFVIAVLKIADLGYGDNLWLLVHDEVILQVPAADADEVVRQVTGAMTFTLYGVPVTAEAEVLGDRWGSL